VSILYFEDFAKGQIYDCGTYDLTREEIIAFAREFDPQPHHLDDEAAKESILGGLSASGWHSCAIIMRLFAQGLLARAAGQGGPGVDECRWIKPVRPGDHLHLNAEIIETRVSKSRPQTGLVKFALHLSNAQEDLALVTPTVLFARREAAQ
jgi:acyl dehydratase